MAAVEAGLLLPLYIIFAFAIMEIGRAAYIKGALTFAVQEGSRYAMIDEGASIGQLRSYIVDHFLFLTEGNVESFEVSEILNGDETRTVDIALGYRFQSLLPILHIGNFTISASAQVLRMDPS
jgi:Flp pilus assembly protein TadG